jgi:hypothetical protein
MEDNRTVCDVEDKGKPQEKPKERKEGTWELVNRFSAPLREYERFSVFQFIMILFFLLVGFALGWICCLLGCSIR